MANPHATIIFSKALGLSDEEREQFLIEGCGDDLELRNEVQSLLAAHPRGKAFFEEQAVAAQDLLAEPRAASEGPPRTIGHYEIDEELGSGGMGTVYSGRDLALGRRVAIKLLREDMDVGTKVRLLHEAEASARLQHPGIATFYEAGEVDGTSFLAMELVEGETLRTRLGSGPLNVPEALRLGASLLEALGHAHAARILHRDIKPENIMLSGDRVKLLDFGIAKVVEDIDQELSRTRTTAAMMTEPGQIVGTVGYMSPEQLRGEPIDPRSDLFAVGVVLYESLSGRHPFPGKTMMERLSATLSGKPPPLKSPVGGTDLERVIRKALSGSASERYSTVGAFLSDLRRIDEGHATASLPESLAIFDFENLSGNDADDWIGSGIAESLVADLRQVEGLQVIPREKVVRTLASRSDAEPDDTAELGRALGCRWILAGSFQKMGPSLRVTSQLSEASTGATIKSEKVDGTVHEIFAIQDRLAESAAGALDLNRRASPEQTPEEARLEAYELYSRGRRLFLQLEKGPLEQAAELYERATVVDPAFGPALAGLAGVYAIRWGVNTDPELLERAYDLGTRALASDPTAVEGYVWRGYALMRQGDPSSGLAEEETAMKLGPEWYYAPYFAGLCRCMLGDLPAARSLFQKCLEIHPLPYAYAVLGSCHLELGNYHEAQWSFEKLGETLRHQSSGLSFEAGLAECLRRQGKLAEARSLCMDGLKHLEATDSFHRDLGWAQSLSLLGRIALAQKDLEAARAAFNQAITHMEARPRAVSIGHVFVQTLAGLARVDQNEDMFVKALTEFDQQEHFNFAFVFPCGDGPTLLELSRAASSFGHIEKARELLVRARSTGSLEARLEPMP